MKPVINTTQRTQKFLELNDYPFHTYVQFGKAKKRKKRPRVVVNPLSGLQNTRDKFVQQQLLLNAGLRVPQFFGDDVNAVREFLDNGGVVVAKRFKHSKGRGMKKFSSREEFENDIHTVIQRYYFQEFQEMNREWRIHVSKFQDEAVVAYRKCFKADIVEQYIDEVAPKPWFRNLVNCYFKLDGVEEDKKPWFDDMVLEAKRAIEVLGMDIAGIDMGENTKVDGGKFVIYEVNSACGMEEHTRSCYEKAIDKIINVKAQAKRLV